MDSPLQDTAGALVGILKQATVSGCYILNGSVTGADQVALLIGHSSRGIVSNCYATGNATGVFTPAQQQGQQDNGGKQISGLVAVNNGIIEYSFAAARITGTAQLGGLVGFQGQFAETIDSYWDSEISEIANMCGSQGTGAGGCDDLAARNTEQMKRKVTFQSWDFANIWEIDENETYPFLRSSR